VYHHVPFLLYLKETSVGRHKHYKENNIELDFKEMSLEILE